ncbi:ATP-binding protein [Kaarinaea lacus]
MISFERHCHLSFNLFIFAMLVTVIFPATADEKAPLSKPNPNHLRISAARSAHDLRIIEGLAEKFKEKNPDVSITINSGGVLAVIEQGRKGDADVVLTHHKPAELKFVAEGFASKRSQILFTEYALFGPPGDALGLTKLKDIASVFRKLADAEAEFYVPSPRSGTNMKIQELWTLVGIDPSWLGYENTGASGYATLLQAAEFGTYAVAEMATYLVNREKLEGKIIPLFRDDLNLRNVYSLLVVNPEKVAGVNIKLATKFHDFLVSEEGQDTIRTIGEKNFNAMVLQPAAHLDPGLREEKAKRRLEIKSKELHLAVISSAALFALLMVSLFLFMRMRSVQRKHSESELRNEALVQAQEKILQTNKLLQSEIEERKITERRLSDAVQKLNQSERELKLYHDHLESLVSSRTRDLELAIQELQAFSYSVSHDLRSPLRSINGFSHALLEDYKNVLDETGKQNLNRVIKASVRMGHLIDDLLLLSRISSQEIVYKDINLGEIAQEVFDNLKDDVGDRNIIVEIDNEMYTKGDGNLVRIILENLIGNALKYTSKNQQARIAIGKVYRNSNLCFFVKDNGVGFDMKYADKLFGPFQRLHTEEEFKGNGIGLSTVQRIVHRHGGVIWTESNPGEGAIFYFTLAPFTHEHSGNKTEQTSVVPNPG